MAAFFALPGWALPLARRVLFFWVRTTSLPARLDELGLDPERPVCYVLQDPGLASRLVLFEETRRRSLPTADTPLRIGAHVSRRAVFSLHRRHRISASARERYAHPPLMQALIRAALADPQHEIQIVPVTVLWGRGPDKQESILKALFAETWRRSGPLHRLFTLILHGRNVLVRFSPPISLGALSLDGLDEAQALRKLSRVLRVHFRRQREMAIGPDLSHRHTQIETMLYAPTVRAAIEAESKNRGIPLDDARRRARRYALEIASDYAYGVLKAFELFLSWLWSHLYDGIEIYRIDVLTRIAPGQGIVYVPTHRSHLDYLLLSYLLYRQGLTPPHIAAGANLNIPLLGPLLRRCGAFFLRRSFKGDALYAAVFHEYLHVILTRGFPLEYFIEGGRSRSGRTLTPKAGILGMTVRSFIRERARPLVFVPVYIGYEKIMEGRTYVAELAGRPKQKESLWSILRSITDIKKVFGKVHVNFGQPLALDEFLETCRPGWRENALADDVWARQATLRAATELATRLNEAAVLNPVNLAALALLASPRHALDIQVLERQLGHLCALAVGVPFAQETVVTPLSPREIVDYAERLGLVGRTIHPLGDIVSVREQDAPLLAYFRNNALHLFALPALVACLISNQHRLSRARIVEATTGIFGMLKNELFLRWEKEALPGIVGQTIEVLADRQLVFLAGETVFAGEPNGQEYAELRLVGETVRPLLERHFLALALLEQGGPGAHSRQSLEEACHLLAQRLAMLYTADADPAERAMFGALIGHLIDSELIAEDANGRLHFDRGIVGPLAYAELVLPAELRQTIRRMAGSRKSGDEATVDA